MKILFYFVSAPRNVSSVPNARDPWTMALWPRGLIASSTARNCFI